MRRHDAVAALRIASGGVISPASGRIASNSRVARSATASGRTGPSDENAVSFSECPGSRDVALTSHRLGPRGPRKPRRALKGRTELTPSGEPNKLEYKEHDDENDSHQPSGGTSS